MWNSCTKITAFTPILYYCKKTETLYIYTLNNLSYFKTKAKFKFIYLAPKKSFSQLPPKNEFFK